MHLAIASIITKTPNIANIGNIIFVIKKYTATIMQIIISILCLSLLLPNFFLKNNMIRAVGQRANSRIRDIITHSTGLRD